MSVQSFLSVIVVFFNMGREAERTLYTLSTAYQKDVTSEQYEVIAVDNGSSEPLNRQYVESFGSNFNYIFYPTESSSPVEAINKAVAHCQGSLIMVMIDGAHMLSPGIITNAFRVFRAFSDPFIAVVGFHLGPEIQNSSVSKGYNQQVEDALLDTLDWRDNGYNLFKLSQGLSYDYAGWFGILMESNCFFMRKDSFLQAGGFNLQFTETGGGLAILDLFHSLVSNLEQEYIVLLGEGSFHQFHGGVASNAPFVEHPWERFHEQYKAIKGHPFQVVVRRPIFFGGISPEAASWSRLCAQVGLKWWEQRGQLGDKLSVDAFGYAMAAARAVHEKEQTAGDFEQRFYDLQHNYDLLTAELSRCDMRLIRESNSYRGKLMTFFRQVGRLLKTGTKTKLK